MEIIKKKVKDLNPAVYNPRKDLKPGDEEYEALKKSIEKFGYIDPIIYNKRNNVIVGGHQRFKVLKDLGYKEVDCVEVDLDEQEEKTLNIALNKVGGDWDFEALELLLNDLKPEDIEDLNLKFEELDSLNELLETDTEKVNTNEDEEDENPYTTKINIPQYEIKGECPNITELVDLSKTKQLLKAIDESDVSEDQKEFLRMAAYRHNAFSYSKVAEYYAHQDKEMQQLMEDSALVIIDYNNAIKNGYAELIQAIEENTVDNKGE